MLSVKRVLRYAPALEKTHRNGVLLLVVKLLGKKKVGSKGEEGKACGLIRETFKQAVRVSRERSEQAADRGFAKYGAGVLAA